ncbi:TetR/AcrR family transcriptional regulator, partial [Streptomyces sp. NPDC001356]
MHGRPRPGRTTSPCCSSGLPPPDSARPGWACTAGTATARHALTAQRPRATMGTMETNQVSSVSLNDERRADVIVEAAGRLFFGSGLARVSMDDLARELGMSKKTIYR